MKQVILTSKKSFWFALFTLWLCNISFAQIRIGLPTGVIDGSASLDVKPGPYSSGSPYRGLLMPTMNTLQRNQIQSPATGLLVFNTSTNQLEVNIGTPAAPSWNSASNSNNWNITGNANLVEATNFIGTVDFSPLNFRVANQTAGRVDPNLFNLGMGYFSINPSTTGTYNTAVGSYALRYNTTGIANTAAGAGALTANTSGTGNVGIGHDAMIGNINGIENTGVGQNALRGNTSGYSNTALGADAMYTANTSYDNTAVGGSALFYTTNGYSNTGVGALALRYNTTGYSNVAIGNYALQNNINGYLNTSIGYDSGPHDGYGALHNTVAIGSGSRSDAIYSVAIGSEVTINPSANGLSVAIGSLASVGANVYNSTVIGSRGTVNTSNTIVLGDAQINSLRCNVQSISTLSDRRIKEDIKQDVPGLNFITKLKPVTYRINKYKEAKLLGYPMSNVHEDIAVHTGFIAQDVEKAAKEIGYKFEGVRQEEGGKYYTVGYTLFVTPLVQAVKELNAEVESLKAQLSEARISHKQLEAQVEQIQKILGLSKVNSTSTVSKK